MIDNQQDRGPQPDQPFGPGGWFGDKHGHGNAHLARALLHGHLQGHHGHGFFGGRGGGHGRDHFGGRHGGGWGGFGPGGPGGPGRERLERGMLRYVILDLLRDGPKHGYEIIKYLEERTDGRYSPSPGTLYPTLQYLEDLALVRSDQEEGRRVYQLTDAGRAELEEHSHFAQDFWSRFHERVPSGATLQEINFLKDALHDLTRTVGRSLHSAIFTGNPDTIRRMRQTLERCQNEIREIIGQAASTQSMSDNRETPPGSDDPDAPGQEPGATRSF